MSHLLQLSDHELDESAIAQLVRTDGAGGVVTFVGRVRERSNGRQVVALEYEAYPEMVDASFQRIALEARRDFDIIEVVIHHRIGSLSVGDVSVVVAVAAAHRAAAFDACRFVIDRLKQTTPIWKKELYSDGSAWVGAGP
ncbi:MAG: molybdenum cofactor biosynthesis protein MoaE [Candidatus Eremiobacteraeota bacterium]|nr:molybdenum cofactor biosynthesis protein MoaE [Candidatus Eremiobacteraeota bacterium]